MSDFTYEFPDAGSFMYTLREYLGYAGNERLQALLTGATCSFIGSSDYSGIRWNSCNAEINVQVPVSQLHQISDADKATLLAASAQVFPPEAGFELRFISLSARMMSPPDDDISLNNTAMTGNTPIIIHDGLRFRSKSETRIYDALKKRNVLFFANSTAILGGKGGKREPDFLVCDDGRWGILEVMGDQYHPSSTASRDHERGRQIKDYGITVVEFFSATECWEKPDDVVDRFLGILKRS